jgi:molybdate transport system regulatory protein
MAKQKFETEIQLRLRVVQGGSILFGPGRADLLELIQDHGSIAAAGRQMGMSYKRAWALVDSMNTTFAAPLVEAAKGGAGGGGAKLTPLGIELLSAYRTLEQRCVEASAGPLARFRAALPVSPVSPVSPEQKSG